MGNLEILNHYYHILVLAYAKRRIRETATDNVIRQINNQLMVEINYEEVTSPNLTDFIEDDFVSARMMITSRLIDPTIGAWN